MNDEQKKDYFLPISILVSGVLISASILYAVHAQQNPSSGDSVKGAAAAAPAVSVPAIEKSDVVLGDANAPVTLMTFGDYQCPYCAMFYNQTEKKIRDSYVKDGKVKMVFRGFQFLGPESKTAGEAAECAKEQNKFWEMHDAIYDTETIDKKENNGNLTVAFFTKTAKNLGMDEAKFSSCMSTGKYKGQVDAMTQAAGKYGVQSTPTFFLNGTKYDGALPFEGPTGDLRVTPVKDMIDALLKKGR